MTQELMGALRELERERGISFETLLHGLEEALASAYKSHLVGEEEEEKEVRVSLDPEDESGEMQVFIQTYDESGNLLAEEEAELSAELKGRIAAQTAKQVILQKIREAEREMTYEEFAGREGDVVTGIVQTIVKDDRRRPPQVVLDLGKVEALLPQSERVPAEAYHHGDRLKAYVIEVRRDTKGPQIIVSRTHPQLLKALFELEVPEMAEGIVEIKAVAREPGHRSKIAVASREPGVDPVGACVGTKGSRVRMVVNELRGEKIDVVEWSEDPVRFVASALAPAKVKEVRIDEEAGNALAVVPDYQLSLAIGKEGQNARLAARLTGWRIDIKSETQVTEEQVAPAAPAPREQAAPAEAEALPAEEAAPAEEAEPALEEEAAPAEEAEPALEEEAAAAPDASEGVRPDPGTNGQPRSPDESEAGGPTDEESPESPDSPESPESPDSPDESPDSPDESADSPDEESETDAGDDASPGDAE